MQPPYEMPPGSPPPPKKGILQTIGGWFVAGTVAVIKFKFLIFAALKTSLSMLIAIGAYTLLFGWKFAVGIVIMIFLHEMGHVIASLWCGVRVTGMMFVPFVGAYTTRSGRAKDAYTDAIIAYGGPLLGFLVSWICLVVGVRLQSDLIIAVASIGFLLNLFNLIPVPPLDGGSICAAISRSFWIVGLILLGASLFYFHNWLSSMIIIVIIVFATLPMMRASFFVEPTEEMQAYYNTHISNRVTMAILYVGLIALLLLGYVDSSNRLSHLTPDTEETSSSDSQ